MQRVIASLLGVLLCVPFLASAAPAPKSPAPSPAASSSSPYQVGRASWYGKRFHGRKTANGETYNMFDFTAAHRRLPLGTWVKVTNTRNGKWLVVRINDRGPYAGNRVIDLSYSAASLLGFKNRGTEKVRIDVVPAPETVARAETMAGLD
jgi:rare lipoprotein A